MSRIILLKYGLSHIMCWLETGRDIDFWSALNKLDPRDKKKIVGFINKRADKSKLKCEEQCKPFGDDLFELKPKPFRIIYFKHHIHRIRRPSSNDVMVVNKPVYVISHMVKKCKDKVFQREIKLAKKRRELATGKTEVTALEEYFLT